MDAAGTAGARAAVLALLATRTPGATVCPSEVARRLAAAAGEADWRARMAEVHAAVDALAADGRVRLSWKGVGLALRAGPYRIASGEDATDRPAQPDAPDPPTVAQPGSIRSQRLP